MKRETDSRHTSAPLLSLYAPVPPGMRYGEHGAGAVREQRGGGGAAACGAQRAVCGGTHLGKGASAHDYVGGEQLRRQRVV